MSEANQFSIQGNLAVPSRVIAFPVSKDQWLSIRQGISKINPPSKLISGISSALFGVTASAIVAIFTITKDLTAAIPYISPLLWIVVVVSLLIAVALMIIDSKLSNTDVATQKDGVLNMMNMISQPYPDIHS